MAKRTGLNITTGVASFFVLACGIAFITVAKCVLNIINEDYRRYNDRDSYGESYSSSNSGGSYGSYWVFGFAFVITGLIGMLSACVKNRGTYITHLVFGIITLLIKGASFVYCISHMSLLSSLRTGPHCITVGETCMCENGLTYNDTCENTNKLYSMIIAIFAVVVIGWVFTLISTIMSGVLMSKVKPEVTTQRPMHSVLQMPPQAGLYPQTHDKAQLVSNMEYQPGLIKK